MMNLGNYFSLKMNDNKILARGFQKSKDFVKYPQNGG